MGLNVGGGGGFGVHWVQYCFSMLEYGWSSFISILSVSWSILVEVLEDIGSMLVGWGR